MKGTHQVEALFAVEADDADDARHIVLGLIESGIRSVKIAEVRPLPLRHDDLLQGEDVLTADDLRRIWDNSPPLYA